MEIYMKTAFVAVLLLASVTAFPAIAADEHGAAHGDGHKAEAGAEANHAGRGKVVAVDNQAGTVKLAHEPIPSLKWPKMTMNFTAHDPALLKDIKPGTQVDFELMKMGGAWHIMKISPTAN